MVGASTSVGGTTEADDGGALQHLVDLVVRLVGPCEAVSVSMTDRAGGIRTLAASSAEARRGDELQTTLSEGPSRDLLELPGPVQVDDLAEDPRWPEWSMRVHAATGMRSMLHVPERARHQVAALTMYSRTRAAFDDRDAELAGSLAALAACSAADASHIAQLKQGLANRAIVGQAVGILMATQRIDSDTAFRLLGKRAAQTHRKVADLAQALVDGQAVRS